MKEKPKLAEIPSADFLKLVDESPREELLVCPAETVATTKPDMATALATLPVVPTGDRAFRDILNWWEKRRWIYNAVIVCTLLFELGWTAILHSSLNFLFALISVPLFMIAVNLGYTLGWVTEYALSRLCGLRSPSIASRLFLVGTILSLIWILYNASVSPIVPFFGNG